MHHLSNSNKQHPSKAVLDLVLIILLTILSFAAATYWNAFERLADWSRTHEKWQADELITVSVILVFVLGLYAFRRWQETLSWEKILSQKNAELQKSLQEVKVLHGILPICANCKKIRNAENHWEPIEVYVRDRTEAEFSHGLCPDCAKKLYPDYFKD